jgi:N-hydroxyarylamine O-acetyltransferase
MGEAISLEEEGLLEKIVDRRRGGFCYELNGLFTGLLTALGFEVTLLAARVFNGDELGPPYDHLVLHVNMGEPWLADVGFGRHTLYPLRLDDRADQADPDGTFTIVDAAHNDVDVLRDGQPQYRLERRPRQLSDFEPMCWWHQTSPRSHFTRSLTCSLRTEAGRVTLSDRSLIVTDSDGRHETELPNDEAILEAYDRHFGIVLEHAPHITHRHIDDEA